MTEQFEYFDADESGYEDTYASVHGDNTQALLAQTFTIGTTGRNVDHVVSEIQLGLSKDGTPAGDLTVEIRTVDGTNKPDEVMASGTISISDIGAADTWLSCTNLRGNLTLSASTMYAIVIYHTNANVTDHIEWWGDNAGANGTSYSGGVAYYSTDGGASWTANAAIDALDYEFKIFGGEWTGTLCTYEDVLNKVGAGANSIASSINSILNFVIQAESILNVRTRYNWTNNYASIDVDYKYIINKVVSNLAAIEVIRYDVTGYDSRLETQDMISNLRSEAEMLMYILSDDDTQTFMV